jgi:hypothetical protein
MSNDCGGVCKVFNDPDNCGGCGNVCPLGDRYCGGTPNDCRPCSTVGLVECNGRCVDVNSDQGNCGDCNNPCGLNQACVNKTCVIGQQ